jgi:hypothetical protein
MSIEISVSDSAIPNALDQYYSALRLLLQPSLDQNIALNSTLVSFDIIKEAPLYAETVFRGFADRKVKLSPTTYGFGAADVSDRFSELYSQVLEAVTATIDRTIDPEDTVKIDNLRDKVRKAQRDLQKEYLDVNKNWIEYKTQAGITDKDPELLEKQIAYFNTMNFADTIKSYKNEIADHLEGIERIRIRSYPDQEAILLARLYRAANTSEYLMARPNSPDLEVQKHYDELKLAQMWIYGNLGGTFDVSQEVRPSGTLKLFLSNTGARGFSIEKGHTAEYSHDQQWGGNGSVFYDFFKIGANVQYESHYRESLKKVRSIKLNFKNLAEYWVRRGRWYSSSLFGFQRVKNWLKDHPRYAADLTYVITSVVIGRGLELSLNFTDEDDIKFWDKLDIKTSFGLDIFGMTIPIADANYGSNSMTHTVDTAKKTVTFADNDEHCRLVAFRVEKLLNTNKAVRAAQYLTWEEAVPKQLMELSKGKHSYGSFQELFHDMTYSEMFSDTTPKMLDDRPGAAPPSPRSTNRSQRTKKPRSDQK